MTTTLLIVGDAEEAHAKAVAGAAAARGVRPAFLDFRRFPGAASLTWDPVRRRGALELVDETLDLACVRSVYWRTAGSTRASAGLVRASHEFAEQEARRALESLLRGLDCPVINSPAAVAAHRHKPVQSATVAALGVAVPEQIVTSDPAAVARMFAAHPGGLVVKPVGGGAYVRRVTRGDLARTASIRACPMQYQQWIRGEDLRVYVVGDEVLAGRIVTRDPDHVDFRTDAGHVAAAVTLADDEAAMCRRIARALGLAWTGIDLRRTPAGELVFLEANPSPMFLRFAADTGLGILDALVELLLG